MSKEDFIITIYCLIEEIFHIRLGNIKLRQCGRHTKLSDCEVITMLVFGEYFSLGSDKKIWQCFKNDWRSWFPNIGCRTSFTRQSSNLHAVYLKLQAELSDRLCYNKDLFLFDGFPIPLCNPKRFTTKNPFTGIGSFGFCAAKEDYYFGFKGHLIITSCGITKTCSVAPANIDEREMLLEISEGLTGDIIADKGLISQALTEILATRGINLHTPLRDNMHDTRPGEFVKQIMNIRRLVETVIGQLTERFKIQAIKAKDLWHLMAKVNRKILAHTVCIAINQKLNPDNPLQLERIYQS